MKRSSMLGSAAALAIMVSFSAPDPAHTQDLGLVKDLAGLGVTTSQASGGLMAIMQLAQTNLGPADFGRLMGMVPGIGDFMGAAGGGAAGAGAMGAAAGAMGAAPGAGAGADDAAKTDATAEATAGEGADHTEAHEAHEAAQHEAHAAAPAKPADAAEAEGGCCGDEMGGAAGAMGGAAGAMGGAAAGMPQITGLSELAAVPSLVSAFSGLGLGPEMIQQFVPIILKYVMGSGGSAAGQLLATGLGLGIM